MSNGRINSPESIRLASEVVRAFGSWDAVERAARPDKDGIHVIRRSQIPVENAAPRNVRP